MEFENNIPADDVGRSRYKFYVEGDIDSNDSIDVKIVETLLKESDIEIKALGKSISIEIAAEALFEHDETCYFLIDRDHHSEDKVDKTWKNFPDKNSYNLLIWRRREIENYFIEPAYMALSKYCVVSEEELEKKILEIVNKRLFLDITNLTLISMREKLKSTGIKLFREPKDFKDTTSSLQRLQELQEINSHGTNVNKIIASSEIKKEFDNFHKKMTKQKDKAQFGVGDWLKLIKGKYIFNELINSKKYFEVKDRNGKLLQGNIKSQYIVKELLGKENKKEPNDFKTLRELVKNIME